MRKTPPMMNQQDSLIHSTITSERPEPFSSDDVPHATVVTAPLRVEVAASIRPCNGLAGGDCCEVLTLQSDSNHLLMFIADAVGHGARAAKLIAKTRSLLRQCINETSAPGAVLSRLNQGLYGLSYNFVTAFLGVINLQSLSITYANAGHPAPLLLRKGKIQVLNTVLSLPLGIEEDEPYKVTEFPLVSGDTILALTDGVYDARNSEGADIGITRVKQIVCNSIQRPHEIVERVVSEIERHEAGGKQWDDQTLLALRI